MDLRERLENFTNGRRAARQGVGFLRYLTGWTLALAFVFSAAADGNDDPGVFASRFVYWLVHVGTGLLAISLVTALLQRGPCGRLPAPLQLALYGLAGAVAFTPIAILFETWWPVPGGPEGQADWLVDAAREGWWRASLTEFGGLAPSFLGSWLVINLAYLTSGHTAPAIAPRGNPPPSPVREALADPGDLPRPVERAERLPAVPVAHSTDSPAHGESPEPDVPPPPTGLRARLPRALGADLIHLRADLNYLHVTTVEGSAMMLYSLARAAEEFADLGLVVHRAHWVACAHVIRSRRTAQGLVLTLSNGTEVPVSRRRQAEVRARFGDSYQSVAKAGAGPMPGAPDAGATAAPQGHA